MQFTNMYCKNITSAVLIIFPLLMINVHHAANFLYIFLFFICTLQFIPKINLWPIPEDLNSKYAFWLILCFGVYPSSIIIHYLFIGDWNAAGFDAPSRFLMAIPITWTLFKFQLKNLNLAYMAAIFGSWIALAEACYQIVFLHQQYAMTYFTWPSNFGCMVLVLGIFSLGFYTGKPWRKILAVSGLLATLISSYLSQSRASWLVIIVLSTALILLRRKGTVLNPIKLMLILVTTVLIFYFSVPAINARINMGWHELTAPLSDVSDTSIGLRRQFWKASFLMIKEHPVLGVGRFQFKAEKSKLVSQGILTPGAEGYAHPHNELLFAQVELGIMGLIGILALYLGPSLYFLRSLSDSDQEIRRAAILGMMVVACYFIFGLVDVMMVAWVMEAPVFIVGVLIPIFIINSRKLSLLK